MKNQKIIEMIKKVCVEKEDPCDLWEPRVYMVLAHSYYFVSPGEDFDEFAVKLGKAMENGALNGARQFRKQDWLFPIQHCVYNETTALIRNVLRESFDELHFNKQITGMEDEDSNDTKLLDKYINKFDEEQLTQFLWAIDFLAWNHCLFMDMSDSMDMENTFNDLCREIDASIPSSHSKDSDELHRNFEFRTENRWYIFDYLSKETIVKIILDHIVSHKVLAGNLAKALYYCKEPNMAAYYALLSRTCQSFYGVNAFEAEFYE